MALQLDHRNAGALDRLQHEGQRFIDKYADRADKRRQLTDDAAHHVGTDLPRTWRKDKTQRIGSRTHGRPCIFQRGDATHLDGCFHNPCPKNP
ncbi:hypothetical protein D3C76_1230250 [compost metagenome]